MPDPSRRDPEPLLGSPRPTSLEDAVESYLAARRAGDGTSPREFAERHAELGGDLASALEALVALEGAAPAPAAERAREVVGAFRIVREVGRGGMGVVYEAREEPLGRRVALKLLPNELVSSAAARARLEREARLASRLEHSGIATVYRAGVDADEPWIAMRFVDGRTLASSIARDREAGRSCASPGERSFDGAAAVRAVVECAARVARTLQFAHEQGIVHRDVKPSNIMVGLDGAPVLLDFGLAIGDDGDGQSLTRTGQTVGTPAYLAPELVNGERARPDPQCDVYALGVTLYECLALRRPFEGPTPAALYRAIESGAASDVRAANRTISRDLAVVVATAMERDPRRRYASAAAFAADLEALLAGRPIVARPVPLGGRVLRWARREPRQAALAAGLALASVVAAASAGNWLASRSVVLAAEHVAREQEREEALNRGYAKLLASQPSAPEFERAAALDPGNLEALAGRALAACLARHWDEGARILEPAPRSPGFDALRSLCARVPVRQDAELAGASEAGALDFFLTGLALHVQALRSEYDQRRPTWKRSLAMADEAVVRARTARSYAHVLRAWAADGAEDQAAARSSAGALATLWPDSPIELCAAGRAIVRFDPDGARALYTRAAELAPGDHVPLHQLGVIAFQRGDLETCEAAMRRSIAAEPSAESWNVLAACLAERGCLDEARPAFALAAAMNPRLRPAWNNLGQLAMQEDAAAAVPYFEHLLDIDRMDPEAHARLGFALFTLGRREEGRDHVALSVAIDGRDPEVWAWFVQQEHELGELDVARDVALEGARRFPKNAHLAQWCDELQAR